MRWLFQSTLKYLEGIGDSAAFILTETKRKQTTVKVIEVKGKLMKKFLMGVFMTLTLMLFTFIIACGMYCIAGTLMFCALGLTTNISLVIALVIVMCAVGGIIVLMDDN